MVALTKRLRVPALDSHQPTSAVIQTPDTHRSVTEVEVLCITIKSVGKQRGKYKIKYRIGAEGQ